MSVTAADVEAVAGWVARARAVAGDLVHARAASCSRTSPACRRSSTSPRCATRCTTSEATRRRINPLLPVELVIDHSVQVDEFATRLAIFRNAELEFERNRERYAFLRWGQGAFDNFKVVPPSTGIVHQVNLEFLARVVDERDGVAFPDTLVGTDSHTTMINGLGVLGWGVGGIEAEAAMLGEAISMLVPQVVGFRLTGRAARGRDRDRPRAHRHADPARDRRRREVRRVLRARARRRCPLADRATIGNMSPEYGATCGFFPVDDETLRYLRLTGRARERIALVEAYCKENALWHDPDEPATYSQIVELDLATVEPSLAGPAAAAGPRAAARGEARVPRGAPDASASTTATPTTRPSPSRSRPATRRVRCAGQRAGGPTRGRYGAARGARRASAVDVDARRRDVRARPRRRRDRRDHVVHEHVEPGRDGRRRAAREEGASSAASRASRG